MKLIIKRDQKEQKGILGGHKGMHFVLSYRIELTQEESDLVAKYKAEEHPLTYTTTSDGTQIPKETISRLTQGVSQEVGDITILLNNEDVMTNNLNLYSHENRGKRGIRSWEFPVYSRDKQWF